MNSGHVTSQSLNFKLFSPQNRGPCFFLREVPQHFGRTVRNQNIALLAKWAVQTQDNIITYVRKGIRTNENRGKQCKTHGKYRTVANMQSKSKVYMGVVLNYCSHKGLLGRACANLARFLRDHTPGSLSSFQLPFIIIFVLVFEC